MCHFYQAQQPKTFFCPGGLAGMGWAVPAALGLKIAQPGRPVLGVAGDGGFMMSVYAIATAVQYELPVVWLVMNDSSLGMVRQHQKDRLTASEFGAFDHTRIAQGFGADGLRVEDPRDLPDAIPRRLRLRPPHRHRRRHRPRPRRRRLPRRPPPRQRDLNAWPALARPDPYDARTP